MNADLPIVLRPGNPDTDLNYVRSSWLKTYSTSDFAKSINHDLFFKRHTVVVNDLLSRCLVTVACDPEDPSFIFGWIAYELDPACVHYVCVKNRYRRDYGVGKRLLTAAFPDFGNAFVAASHYPSIPTLKERCWKEWKVVYDPYAALLPI